MKYDVLIIGAGIIGSLTARELSRYKIKVAVLDKENDVGNVTTMANSAIVHSGYDPVPGTNKAKFNVLGNPLYDKLCDELDVHFYRVGSLTVALYDEQLPVLEELAKRSKINGVDVKFETVNAKLRLCFDDSGTKKYIVAYLNGTYDNFGIFTEEELSGKTVFDWFINSDGRLVAECRGVIKTLGLKSGQTFTTFALNALSDTVKFIEFEYTAESYAYDFLDNITCDSSGVTSPVYSDGFTWSDFKLIYNNMFGSEKTILSTTTKNVDGNVIERMLARYEYLVWKYHYEDFLLRDVVLSSNSSMFEISNSNNTIVLVLTIIVSASAIGTALLIQKKRKEH